MGAQRPLRVFCAREVQKSIEQSVKHLLDNKIKAYDLMRFYKSIKTEIVGANGTQFIFGGLSDLTADQIKSLEDVDIAWIEEAQTITERSLEALIPTIRKANSEIWLSWNPKNRNDPVDKRFRGDSPPENSIIRRVNYDQNPFFTAEMEAERRYDQIHKPQRYAHIWLGEYEPQAIGAIWNPENINKYRVKEAPDLGRIVVAVDPAISNESNSDENGIVVLGAGIDTRGYVLADMSLKGGPRDWAQRAIDAYDLYEADAIVIEVNQGGDMVRHTLESVRRGIPIIEVRATRGKHVRAEPIAALYSLGKFSHVGNHPELETQMCLMAAGGYEGDGSPDRLDAMVWGASELFPKLTKRVKRPETVFTERTPNAGAWMG